MSDDRLEDAWREALDAATRPPAVRRDVLWTRIEADLRARRVAPRRNRRGLFAAALAAALVLGIGLGRFGARRPAPDAARPAPLALHPRAYDRLVAEHLAQADLLLALVRASARAEEVDAEIAPWARELLATTRLVLDSPAAGDAGVRAFFEDLELVLVQASQLRPGNEADLAYVRQSLERTGIETRLHRAGKRREI